MTARSQTVRMSVLARPTLALTCTRSQLLGHHLFIRSYSRNSSLSEPLKGTRPNILIVRKQRDERVLRAFDDIVSHLRSKYPEATVFSPSFDTALHQKCESLPESNPPRISLLITLGGDGTILRASSLFRNGPVPPVLSFSLGTLGFLLPFHIDSFPRALQHLFEGKYTILHRMRLSCKLLNRNGNPLSDSSPEAYQLMNEVTIHRGRSPHLSIMDAFVDGQHLTEGVADGLIISSPTGSTAYSLSSGGPIVHPSMQALLLTPICPRSLSFRPLVLPHTANIRLVLSAKSRAPSEVSMDGHDVHILNPGDSVTVETSPYPIPCINRPIPHDNRPALSDDTGRLQDGWVQDINRLLNFNASFRSNALSHLEYDREVL